MTIERRATAAVVFVAALATLPAVPLQAQDEVLTAARPIPIANSVWIDELTYLEVRDLLAAGKTTAIVAAGGIEQSGPFLVTGKHNVALRGICDAIARRLGNALCAPVVKFVPEGNLDPPSGHMRYPGTISVRQETYRALLEDIGLSLAQHGFTDVVFIGDSGGNQAGMELVANALNERWKGTGATAHFIREYYDPGKDVVDRYMNEELGIAESRDDGFHDLFRVTAIMMVTDPALVRYGERVEAGLASINGVSIAPKEETIETGRRLIDFLAGYTADLIRDAVAASRAAGGR